MDDVVEEKYKVLAGHFEDIKTIIEDAKADNYVKDDNKMKLSETKEKIISETISVAHKKINNSYKKNKVDIETPLGKVRRARASAERALKLVLSKRKTNLSS